MVNNWREKWMKTTRKCVIGDLTLFTGGTKIYVDAPLWIGFSLLSKTRLEESLADPKRHIVVAANQMNMPKTYSNMISSTEFVPKYFINTFYCNINPSTYLYSMSFNLNWKVDYSVSLLLAIDSFPLMKWVLVNLAWVSPKLFCEYSDQEICLISSSESCWNYHIPPRGKPQSFADLPQTELAMGSK